MTWESFGQFLSMGGYGLYVWGSLGATVALLGAELAALRTSHTKALHRAQRLTGASRPQAYEAAQ
jgi:heme exporter protein D